MAKPGPSTNGHYGNPNGWEAVGYDYRHRASIEGFPNFHEFQVGGVVLMPSKGPLVTVPGSWKARLSGYRSALRPRGKTATAGILFCTTETSLALKQS